MAQWLKAMHILYNNNKMYNKRGPVGLCTMCMYLHVCIYITWGIILAHTPMGKGRGERVEGSRELVLEQCPACDIHVHVCTRMRLTGVPMLCVLSLYTVVYVCTRV